MHLFNSQVHYFRLLILLCLMMLSGWVVAKEPLIYMVLWRGETNAERGFMSYIREQDFAVRYIIRSVDKKLDTLPSIVHEIKLVRPDLVYSFGTTLTRKLAGTVDGKEPGMLHGIPILFDIVSDPVGAGIVASMNRHKTKKPRNVTGVSHSVPLSIQLNAMMTLGSFKHIGILYNHNEINSNLSVKAMRILAEDKQIKVSDYRATEALLRSPSLLSGLAERLKKAGVDLLYLPSDSLIISNARLLISAVHKRGIPTFSATEPPIRKSGALIGVVSNYTVVGRFAGFKALQILRGHKRAGDINVERLQSYSVVVNMAAAKILNFYPPVSMLQFAEVLNIDSTKEHRDVGY